MWFGQTQDGNMAEPDNTLRALPYGEYSLTELLCDANEHRNLIKDLSFRVSADNENIDLGTIVEPNIEIKTYAKDADSGNHTGTVAPNAKIIDTVQYFSLWTDKKYQVDAELHWAKGLTGSKLNGGIVKDASGREIRGQSEVFSPTQTDDLIDVELGPYDTQKLTAGGTELKGEDTVVFEYLYEVTEDGSRRLLATHADPNDASQIITYPWISTLLTDDDTGLRMGLAREKMQITDDMMTFPGS